VFAAHVLPQLLAFALGQAAAWYYLRSGRVGTGLVATIALWGAIDWWAVARYVLGHDELSLRTPALVLQGTALATVAALLVALWRRRWSATARCRRAHFTAGLTAFLRSEYGDARATFTRLVRADPWDAAAWIALGDVLARTGARRRARRCYRRAGAVDVRGAWTDLLQRRRAAIARSAAVSRRADR
jgi:hypothetical protein